MVQKDDIDAQSVALAGLCGAILVYVIIIGLQVLFYRAHHSDLQKKYVEAGWYELKKMQTEHQTRLSTYGWADASQTEAKIPVDKAMELTVERLQGAH